MQIGAPENEIRANTAAADIAAAMAREDNSEDDDTNAHFEEVSKMYIKTTTRDGYDSSNRTLLLWLVDKHPECVSEEAKTKLTTVFAQQPAASVKTKNTAVVRAALVLIKNATDISQPIVFETLTVRIFVDFLHARARNNKEGSNFLSKSGCGSYRSAFKELYRRCGLKMGQDYEDDLKTKFKGLNRGHAYEKEKTGGRLTEGKDPMSFALYKLLCKKMLEDGSKEAIFAHAFLTMTWNLICRSKNTVNIHRNHITWGSDSITIRFAHTKTDVEGGDQARLRHVFANPYNLDICAVTSLAKYLAAFLPKEDGKLFDEKSYQRFQKYLKKIVEENQDAVERLGVNAKDIGVHSIRKGAATYCCGGTTAAPHIAAVCNRAGWTMGKVKDTYIQYAEAGDQHVGRVVAGLPVLDAKYACSPPFFCIDDSEHAKDDTCTSADVHHCMTVLFPTLFSTSPISFKPVILHCAAALVFASEYFNEVLSTR